MIQQIKKYKKYQKNIIRKKNNILDFIENFLKNYYIYV